MLTGRTAERISIVAVEQKQFFILEEIIMSVAIAAALAVIPGTVAGLGIAIATGKASEAIARQPEASGQIRSSLLIGCALAEATAIYGFITALAILILS